MPEAPSLPPLTKADIVEEMWAEAARRHAGAGTMRRAAETVHLALPPVTLPPVWPAMPLPALLALDGDDFVEAAYQTVLGRPPDEAGAALLTTGLAAGQSKVVLLGRLQRSGEGRAVGRALPGLSRRFVIHRIYGVPGLGHCLRLGAAVLRQLGISRLLSGQTALPPVTHAEMHAYVTAYAASADARRETIERRIVEHQMALDLAARRLALLQSAQEEAARKAADLARAQTKHTAAERRRTLALEERLADAAATLTRLEAAVSSAELDERVAAAVADMQRTLVDRMQAAEAAASRAGEAAAAQDHRLSEVIETLRADPAFGRLAAAAAEAGTAAADHSLDGLYVAFEDVFRGTRADIKQRQRVHVPTLTDAEAGTPRRPVLDIGCGRGEFLELLRDHGLAGRGVDANTAMADQCRALGLEVTVDDAVSYLARQDAGSLGAVTGFHIVEHLPFRTMMRLFDEALRALASGGVMILETPNPSNILVGATRFWTDPTHIRPLPSDMMTMFARARGFGPVHITALHPMNERFAGADPVLQDQLDALFHGPQDYALIARKP